MSLVPLMLTQVWPIPKADVVIACCLLVPLSILAWVTNLKEYLNFTKKYVTSLLIIKNKASFPITKKMQLLSSLQRRLLKSNQVDIKSNRVVVSNFPTEAGNEPPAFHFQIINSPDHGYYGEFGS